MTAADARVRFHGLQAIAVGLLWPVLLYAGAALSERVTQVVFATGTVVWLGFLVAASIGRDPTLPVVSRALARTAGYEKEI